MTKEKYKYKINYVIKEITVYRITNDVNGNPQYCVHFLDLMLKNYAPSALTRKAGLRKYNAKWFGGGFSFQSYNIPDTLKYILQTLHNEKQVEVWYIYDK